jgi:hypothetical protein
MNRILPVLLLLALSLFACNNSKTSSEKQTTSNPEASVPLAQHEPYLPSITQEEIEILWEKCNQIDYLFYDLPISSSVNDRPSSQAHIRHISDSPVRAEVKKRCKKPIGRLFYKTDGEDLIEAEAYFSGGCAFFVFFKGGKETYCNLMTPDGVNHFNQIIAAASGKMPAE